MKVYKFSDYLKNGVGNQMPDSAVICEIETMKDFPQGLCDINGKKVHVCMFSDGGDYACIDFIEDMPKVSELLFKHEITCPHCGKQSSDSWEASDSDDEYDCDVCGSVFSYQRNIEVTYSSTIVKVNHEIIKLN